MKINEIINEAAITPYSIAAVDDFDSVLRTHCSEAMETMKTSPLWRGFQRKKDSIFTFDPSTGTRASENTSNYYTLLMDNSPYMQGWPKRSKSLICTTDPNTAGNYGKVYAIFPYNGTKLAVCPRGDLWDTIVKLPELDKTKASWDDINGIMYRLGFTDKSYEAIVKHSKSPKFLKLIKDFPNVPADNFISWLQEKMAPENVYFDLVSVATWSPDYIKREVWFSGPCVAIEKEIYEDWIKNQS